MNKQFEPISAQPVAASSFGGATYAVGQVLPPHAQPQPVYVQSQSYTPVQVQGHAQQVQGAAYGQIQPARRPPPNRWADSICDWPSNLFPSCYCACCVFCGIWISAQIGQKTGYSNFRSILWSYFFFCVLGFIFQLVFGSAFIVWIPMIYAFIYSLVLRLHLVKRDNITECGGCFGEFCIGFWCWYCSIAQMARHTYGYTKVLDGDSDPDRPDGYAGAQQV